MEEKAEVDDFSYEEKNIYKILFQFFVNMSNLHDRLIL